MRLVIAIITLSALAACATAPSVPAVRETAAVTQSGDAADDPAIWVAPQPEQSLVIATQKKGGLYIFNLQGDIVQEAPGGEPNNVDIREGFAWSDGAAPIVGASDRTDNTIVLWRFDPATRRLDPTPRARIATGLVEVYGFCFGRIGGELVAVVTDRDSGDIGVWRIATAADGAIASERIASYSLGSIAEGCVVDDENGVYYVAQELVGIWRIEAEDSDGSSRRLIDRVAGGNLVADVEGLTIWNGEDGGGYLVASVQGASRYAVYDRGGANAYRGAFAIGPSIESSADRVQGTDGIDIVSAPLGPNYPRGLFVAQDDRNTNPSELQNFKYVSWADVETLLGLR
ncbi:phytase [Terricaulis sp.]|uniref:phytase n=1 Tax=Terricaulis sp. TaxID=2768686 RepID=UPI002AC7D58E|nr:phytase [Terricaulis sp.]MDZ4691427.1 phytase [Terricaulis sp.]